MRYSVSNGEGKFVTEVAEQNREDFVSRLVQKGYTVEEVDESDADIETMTSVRSGDLITEVMLLGSKQSVFYGGMENGKHTFICESAIYTMDGETQITPFTCRKALGEHFGINIYKVTLPCGLIHYEACSEAEMDEKRSVYRCLAASIHTESKNS